MKRRPISTRLLASVFALPLAGAALATPAAADPAGTFLGPIMAEAKDAATLTARCDAVIAEVTGRQRALEAETGPATAATTLAAYDTIIHILGDSGGEFSLYREVMADDARRQAGADCEDRLAQAGTRLSLSRAVYDRLKAIPAAGLDAATTLYLSRTLAAFDRSGVALPPAQRAEAQALSDRISTLNTQFNKNIADGRKTISATPADLAGLPADFIASHRPGPDGMVTIATDNTDWFAVMGFATSEDLRHRLYDAYMTRAFPANEAVLRELLDKRQALATLLGRKDFATLVLEDKMLDTPAKVEFLLAEMNGIARPAAGQDYARKLRLWQGMHPGATSFPAWDNGWLTTQVQKADYAYDAAEARPYFAYTHVRDGILALTQQLFGVTIRHWDTPVWAPGVEAYEMVENGKVIGRFYFDAHPRPGKYQHANQIPLRSGISAQGGAGEDVPMGALVMNLSTGGEGGGLMNPDDAATFLHEFGHLLHHIFGGQSAHWAGQSGVATEWDFVEAPSQMLEEWVYDYDTLKAFAVNAQGQPIPRDLVAKMNAARYFNLGMGDMRQLALSNVSLGLHRGPAPADLTATTDQLYDTYDLMPLPPVARFQDNFPHLADYSAVYYTYRWSKVIALDMFTRFQAHGLHDVATAARYRQMVLAPGGSKPAAVLVADFLGRPIGLDAYRAEITKDK